MADEDKEGFPFHSSVPGAPTPPTLEEGGGYSEAPGATPPSLNISDIETEAQYVSKHREFAQRVFDARETFNNLFAEYPDAYESQGTWVIPDPQGREYGPFPNAVPVPELNQAYGALVRAEKDFKFLEDWGKDSEFIQATGASYVDTEANKAAEVRRQFLDFLDRAEATYALNKREGDSVQNALDRQSQQREMQRRGDLAPGANIVAPTFVPSGASLSNMVRRSMPTTGGPPPIYYNNEGAGLEGPQGFANNQGYDPGSGRYGQYGELPRFAAGTDMAVQQPGFRYGLDQADLSDVPQELRWLVGAPDVFAPPLTPDMPRLPMGGEPMEQQPATVGVLDNKPAMKLNKDSMLYSRVP